MKERRKVIISVLMTLMVISILSVIGYYLYENMMYVSTDDARIAGDLVKICPQTSGKIIDFFVDEGSVVEKDQIVGRIETPNVSDQNIEQTIVRSPIKGVIIKKTITVGEIISTGQVMAYVTDPEKFYVTANIEETKLDNVRIGQIVSIKIDQYSGKSFFGKVTSLGKATNSVFSMFPTSTGGTYTKVVQKIPVHIDFIHSGISLVNGNNTAVKIHIK